LVLLRFLFLFAPSERPVRLSSRVVVDLDAGVVGFADIGLVAPHFFKQRSEIIINGSFR